MSRIAELAAQLEGIAAEIDDLITDDRKWGALSVTQRVRRQSHDMTRQWMTEHCNGIFAQSGERDGPQATSTNQSPTCRDVERVAISASVRQ